MFGMSKNKEFEMMLIPDIESKVPGNGGSGPKDTSADKSPGIDDFSRLDKIIKKSKGEFYADGALEFFLGMVFALTSFDDLCEMFWPGIADRVDTLISIIPLVVLVPYALWAVARVRAMGYLRPGPGIFASMLGFVVVLIAGDQLDIYITPLIIFLGISVAMILGTGSKRSWFYAIWAVISFAISVFIQNQWYPDYANPSDLVLTFNMFIFCTMLMIVSAGQFIVYFRQNGARILSWKKSDEWESAGPDDAETREISSALEKVRRQVTNNGLPEIVVAAPVLVFPWAGYFSDTGNSAMGLAMILIAFALTVLVAMLFYYRLKNANARVGDYTAVKVNWGIWLWVSFYLTTMLVAHTGHGTAMSYGLVALPFIAGLALYLKSVRHWIYVAWMVLGFAVSIVVLSNMQGGIHQFGDVIITTAMMSLPLLLGLGIFLTRLTSHDRTSGSGTAVKGEGV